jgi:site-specific recombinase XerD
MKSLPVTSQHYNYLLQSYKEYLQVTGYAAKTCNTWATHVRELFYFFEQQKIQDIGEVTSGHIHAFTEYIKRRKNRVHAGGLSASMINGIINAVNTFAKFINTSSDKYFLELNTDRVESDSETRAILSLAEIKQLYEATFLPYSWNSIAMGQRDRAIIALYYGCGLRRSEGIQLNTGDIDLQKRLVFVRKAKGNKQRYVPIAAKHIQDMEDYLKEGREWFLQHHDSNKEYHSKKNGKPLPRKGSKAPPSEGFGEAPFFITPRGGRFMQPEWRIKYLQQRAGIEREITLHGLRHSIATHLLQSGMDIEDIAKFLGHASLASTQIYTHIVNEHER